MRHQLGGGELSCFFLSSHDIAFKTRNCVPLMTQIYNFHSYKFITRWIHSILERYNVSLERKYQILHRLDFYYFTRSCLLCFFFCFFLFSTSIRYYFMFYGLIPINWYSQWGHIWISEFRLFFLFQFCSFLHVPWYVSGVVCQIC